MSKPREEALSRAVSAIDLTATLAEVQNRPNRGPRYTKDQLLSLRTVTVKHEERVGVNEVAPADGLKTPPYQAPPSPPPPTPTSPENGLQLKESGNQGNQKGENAKTSPPPVIRNVPVTQKAISAINAQEPPKTPKVKRAPASGFEEFFADPPITPDEYEEEVDTYDVERPFHDRMQTCIQRYRARRKLDSIRSNVLTKYLALGGVETSGKMFTGGLDKETLENATAAEISAIQASDFLRVGASSGSKFYDGSDNWVVDWEGVAKGFFSYRVPRMFSIDREGDIKLYASVIRNFLNYVIYHGVCQDYADDVLAARKICDLAEYELWNIRQLQLKLPGDFNIAASTLYGGRYSGLQEEMQSWCGPDDVEVYQYTELNQGFTMLEAQRIVDTSIALRGTDDLFTIVMNPDNLPVRVLSEKLIYFEVVDVERADAKVVSQYAQVRNHKGEAGHMKPLGFLTVKHWDGPGLEPEDCTDDEDNTNNPVEYAIEHFWFEDEILPLFFTGMKFEAVVRELSIGIKYIDKVNSIYCSFWTYLPNEKMRQWKDPVPNNRPPPTEDDPDVEERAMKSIMEDDLEGMEKDFADK